MRILQSARCRSVYAHAPAATRKAVGLLYPERLCQGSVIAPEARKADRTHGVDYLAYQRNQSGWQLPQLTSRCCIRILSESESTAIAVVAPPRQKIDTLTCIAVSNAICRAPVCSCPVYQLCTGSPPIKTGIIYPCFSFPSSPLTLSQRLIWVQTVFI